MTGEVHEYRHSSSARASEQEWDNIFKEMMKDMTSEQKATAWLRNSWEPTKKCLMFTTTLGFPMGPNIPMHGYHMSRGWIDNPKHPFQFLDYKKRVLCSGTMDEINRGTMPRQCQFIRERHTGAVFVKSDFMVQ